ncbi:MAG: PaaI family thioesterase [Rhodobacteraceae bacterium]|nr:PaaI family thioesterase [Paracoccaceae bacterium]
MWNSRAKGLIREMKLEIEKADLKGVQIRMPFNPDFCLDEEGTMLHGGVLTALLDSAFGLANFVAIDSIESMATLDLRVDYLRPAKSRADVLVFADCYRQTRHIAFGSGKIWFDTGDKEEVARGTAAFAITRGTSGGFLDKLNATGPDK